MPRVVPAPRILTYEVLQQDALNSGQCQRGGNSDSPSSAIDEIRPDAEACQESVSILRFSNLIFSGGIETPRSIINISNGTLVISSLRICYNCTIYPMQLLVFSWAGLDILFGDRIGSQIPLLHTAQILGLGLLYIIVRAFVQGYSGVTYNILKAVWYIADR